ncbi:VOC family protein [Rhodococcus erythropolis]|uniref:VOC family protein n=1 Tax=Rhodococcus erythropolis TaxID=1833 RepID=UPI002227C7A4|nr:VOC family protein [Rhodococcus erythropolis]MCW2295370.1 catechol 2,3-dioxygenase-like lactoylglutathione lyase family enzyme [Rhodococcus erythropolis]
MTQTSTPTRPGPSLPGRPKMLSHLAYVTHNVEGTVDFYERVMGMPMVSTVIGDRVPSTGDDFPYFHVFFRLADGSTLAFFEAPDLPPANPRGHPAYALFEHLAFEVDSVEIVDQWHEWLVSNGIDVVGPTDHEIIYSIYFQDPINDIRLEITTPMVENWNDRIEEAQRDLRIWTGVKNSAAEQNQPLREALMKYIQAERPDAHGETPA